MHNVNPTYFSALWPPSTFFTSLDKERKKQYHISQSPTDFQVWLTPPTNTIKEGEEFSVHCEHNLTEDHIIKFIWIKDNKPLPCKNTSDVTLQDRSGATCQSANQLTIDDELNDFNITCKIHSHCGNFTSNTVKIVVTGEHHWSLLSLVVEYTPRKDVHSRLVFMAVSLIWNGQSWHVYHSFLWWVGPPDNSLLILVICGAVAVVLLLAFTLGMKLLLKRDIGKHHIPLLRLANFLRKIYNKRKTVFLKCKLHGDDVTSGIALNAVDKIGQLRTLFKCYCQPSTINHKSVSQCNLVANSISLAIAYIIQGYKK